MDTVSTNVPNVGAQPPEGRVRRPISRKLALGTMLAAVLPVALLGVALMDINARTVEGLARDLQTSAVDELAQAPVVV